jgi:hypothetical protein
MGPPKERLYHAAEDRTTERREDPETDDRRPKTGDRRPKTEDRRPETEDLSCGG